MEACKIDRDLKLSACPPLCVIFGCLSVLLDVFRAFAEKCWTGGVGALHSAFHYLPLKSSSKEIKEGHFVCCS